MANSNPPDFQTYLKSIWHELWELRGILFLVGMLGGVGTLLIVKKPRSATDLLLEDHKSTTNKIDQLTGEIKHLAQRLDAFSKIPPEHALGQQLAGLKVEQGSFDQRMKLLELAVSTDPERALSVPLMRKDLETLEKRIIAAQEAARFDVERLYNMIQWFFGMIVAAILAVIIPHLLKKESKPALDMTETV